jgi:MFS family permease
LLATLILASRAALAYPAGWILDRIGAAPVCPTAPPRSDRRLWLRRRRFNLHCLGRLPRLLLRFVVGLAFFGGSRAAVEQSRYIAAEIFPHSKKAKAIGAIVFAGTIGAIVGPLLV